MGTFVDIANQTFGQPLSRLDLELQAAVQKAQEKFGPIKPDYFLGLDLGQAMDFSALVGLERTPTDPSPAGNKRFKFKVIGVKRWPLRTAYTAIAEELRDMIDKSPLLGGCTLGIDKTGVGAGVLEIIVAKKPNAKIMPVVITAGNNVSFQHGTFNVPKMTLVGGTIAAVESERLAIPMMNEECKLLKNELASFRTKITKSGHETAEAGDWRLAPHDDLCLALAIALFLGQRQKKQFWVA